MRAGKPQGEVDHVGLAVYLSQKCRHLPHDISVGEFMKAILNREEDHRDSVISLLNRDDNKLYEGRKITV